MADAPVAMIRVGHIDGYAFEVDVASKDEKKLAYLRELKVTGEALFEKLKGVLR